MDSDVVFNCGSENVVYHNLLELRFFICLSRFRENIKISKSVTRGGRSEFRIHWGDRVQILGIFVFCGYGVQFFVNFVFCGDGVQILRIFVFCGYGVQVFGNFVFCGYGVQ